MLVGAIAVTMSLGQEGGQDGMEGHAGHSRHHLEGGHDLSSQLERVVGVAAEVDIRDAEQVLLREGVDVGGHEGQLLIGQAVVGGHGPQFVAEDVDGAWEGERHGGKGVWEGNRWHLLCREIRRGRPYRGKDLVQLLQKLRHLGRARIQNPLLALRGGRARESRLPIQPLVQPRIHGRRYEDRLLAGVGKRKHMKKKGHAFLYVSSVNVVLLSH